MPATDTKKPTEARFRSRETLVLSEVADAIPTAKLSAVDVSGTANELAIKVGIARENFNDHVATAMRSADNMHDAAIRRAASMCLAIRRLREAWAEAQTREAEEATRAREAEERRQQAVIDEHNECVRLRRLLFGIDS
jgi:hypothetical protein